MKKILLLATGGTIASTCTDEGGLGPELTAEKLLECVPDLEQHCHVDCRELFRIDSTNMTPQHWLAIADTIRREYDAYDGFVITHGTDTMAYTAAALSYLIQNSPKPILLTGAQKPIGTETTDSRINLRDAFLCASSDTVSGVCIVFNGLLLLGTRARKTRTMSFQAFSSINFPELAVIQDGRILQYISLPKSGPPQFSDRINPSVGLLKLIPGIDIELLEFMLQRKSALIIESFGVGGLPSYDDGRFFEVLRREGTDKGKVIVMTTQVQNEGSNIGVYNVGHRLKNVPYILEAYDMTTESVLAKMMWILGRTDDWEEISRLFYTPVAWDILYRD